MAQAKPIFAEDDVVVGEGAMPFPDPKVEQSEKVLKRGEAAIAAAKAGQAERQSVLTRVQSKHPDLPIRGIMAKDDEVVGAGDSIATQPSEAPPTETPAMNQTEKVLAKTPTIIKASEDEVVGSDMITSSTSEEPVTDSTRIKALHPEQFQGYLRKLSSVEINRLYSTIKTVVPRVPTDTEEPNFLQESQNIDGMSIPMTGPEPGDWEYDVLEGTTREQRQQIQKDIKIADIRNLQEQAYLNTLSKEARKTYIDDKMKNGQKVSSWEKKLYDYGAMAILADVEDVTNPKSDLRLGKESMAVTVGEPTTGDTATIDKPISEWEAISYLLKLDGYDEEDALYQYHKATQGRDWLAMQKIMAGGLAVGAGWMTGLEKVLNYAYESGLAKNINELTSSTTNRKLFSGTVAKDMSNFGEWSFFVGLEMPEMLAPMLGGVTGMTAKVFKTGLSMALGRKALKSKKGADLRLSLLRSKSITKAIRTGEFKERDYRAWLRWKDGNEIGRVPPGAARVNTYFVRQAKIKETKKVAKANDEIGQELLAGTRDRIKNEHDIDIVDEVNGRLVINPERLREAGILSTRKAYDASDQTMGQKVASAAGIDIVQADKMAALRTGTSEIADPMLNPEMFEQMIAVTADLRKTFPDALKTTGDKRLIDKLFDLTVNKDLMGENAPQLQKILDKYNISFENYSLAIVGSGSQAGRILNRLSQLKRLRTGDEVLDETRKAAEESQGGIRRWIMRIENVRRGLLVSQFATAVRNLSSAGIRMPLEALGNVMDNVLYAAADKGLGAGVKTAFSGENWKGSLRGLTYMFSNPRTAKEYTDLILEHPQLDGQFKQLFTNLNEIQKLTGRGSGGMADQIMSVAEDGVSILNIPNRMQEYLVRRSMFMGEMERLVKREWGVNLLDEVGAGRLDELMSKVDFPKGKMSFADMAQAATKRALDVTYAKQPDVAAFRTLSTFITRNGLTVAMPFPRFMFNGAELVGQYAGGASIPLTKFVQHLISKSVKRPFKKPLTLAEIKAGKTAYTDEAFKLTAKDRERISRNILGVGAIAAAYAYRTDESAPSDYKKLKADDGHTIDTSPQFPLRQMLFLGEVVKQLIDPLKGPNDKRSLMERVDPENLANWFSGDKGNIAKEFAQTFIGSNIRSGVGEGIVSEVMDLYKGVTGSQTGLIDSERSAKTFGRLLGNYMATWAVPLAQIVDAQRALGFRTTEKKDAARDPVLGDTKQTFLDNLTRPFRSRIGESVNDILRPSKAGDLKLSRRQEVRTSDPERKRVGAKVLSGLNFGPDDGEEVQYLQKVFNYAPWKIGSKDKRPHIRSYENAKIRSALPFVVKQVKKAEAEARRDYNSRSERFKSEMTERMFVKSKATMNVEAELKKARENITSMRLDAMRDKAGKNKSIKWQLYTEKFRKLPKEARNRAWVEWTKKNPEKEIDYMNPDHVANLYIYGDTYWKAYSSSSSGNKRGLGALP